MIRLRALALFLALFGTQAVEARRLPPVDNCAAEPGFAAFRTQLLRAVARRDPAFIRSIAADDIVWNFGDEPGIVGFYAGWGLGQPATSRIWIELESMFRLGCARDEEGRLWVPALSLAAGEEEDGEEAVEQWLVLGPRVPLRAAPSETSGVVAVLDWEVVTATPDDLGVTDWFRVTLDDGRRGFLPGANIRSLAGHRAVFERRGGQWRMTAFVAGD